MNKKRASLEKNKSISFLESSKTMFVYPPEDPDANNSPKIQLDNLRHSQFTNSSSSDDDLPNNSKSKTMKDKEKKRREEKRVLKLEAQQKAQEERSG